MATKLIMSSPAILSQSKAQLVDFSKPFKNEAVIRLRNSSLTLLASIVLATVLPIPSPWTSTNIVMSRPRNTGAFWFALCSLELLFLGLLSLNIVQALFALKYPRNPLPSTQTPVKFAMTPPTKEKKRLVMSPASTPQPQREFGASYRSSPLSTPSRTLQYSLPPSVSPFKGSVPSIPSTPSPSISSPLAAYRGRHSTSVGQPLDGSVLRRLTSDEDEEE
ncbi:hypothetical protein CONPUDRAFT_169693 [Coniophora puteana RWD-64-598 SS2]|uniref:Uncharacterized protein n=1 Tax=Coniophora puteana (strain RWD-64-598) TaxID=741705 RepID=A0A5M3M911_CONPW|nr:uncharacterized protein CONPUDRAFT_169693 [Coniophora puteana RWD-64-598 SS2]EIW75334.1 hypothetical protein CONPUDRAFT_169693 [Coniophora puteana RWD-64-598 SS2]